jgi:hypothetical protein
MTLEGAVFLIFGLVVCGLLFYVVATIGDQ